MYEPEPEVLDGTWTFPQIIPAQQTKPTQPRPRRGAPGHPIGASDDRHLAPYHAMCAGCVRARPGHSPLSTRFGISHDEWVTADKTRRERPRLGMTQFALGLIVALTAALLVVLDVIESGWAAAIGMLGIGLIATSQVRSGTGSKRN